MHHPAWILCTHLGGRSEQGDDDEDLVLPDRPPNELVCEGRLTQEQYEGSRTHQPVHEDRLVQAVCR